MELNLERYKLDEIKIDYKGDVATQRREMLNHWLNKDHGATYNKLANALIAKNLTQVAKMLVERISKLAPLPFIPHCMIQCIHALQIASWRMWKKILPHYYWLLIFKVNFGV